MPKYYENSNQVIIDLNELINKMDDEDLRIEAAEVVTGIRSFLEWNAERLIKARFMLRNMRE